MTDVMVRVEHVSKKFCRSLKRGMLYTTADVARDLLGTRGKPEHLRPDEFWATRDVSFEIKRGECLGLIGLNGAGKSTLLKMLNGIIRPDQGSICIRGRVGALIEVGAGFHPMLTGRENIYVNGAILGMNTREIDRKFDDIVAFSGLESAILDAPVKTYSSGMYVRLGFAIAVHTEPDVLLIDEVLAVGDARFTGRCRGKIEELRRAGTSMVFVSHSLSLVEQVCNRGMLLANGEVRTIGSVNTALSAYRGYIREAAPKSRSNPSSETAPSLRFVAAEVLGDNGNATNVLQCGSTAVLRVTIVAAKPVTAGVVSVWLMRTDDAQIAGIGYLDVGSNLPPLCSGDLELRFQCQVVPGEYKLGVTFSTDGAFDLVDEFAPCILRVEPGSRRCASVGTYMLNVWPENARDSEPRKLTVGEAEPCSVLPDGSIAYRQEAGQGALQTAKAAALNGFADMREAP